MLTDRIELKPFLHLNINIFRQIYFLNPKCEQLQQNSSRAKLKLHSRNSRSRAKLSWLQKFGTNWLLIRLACLSLNLSNLTYLVLTFFQISGYGDSWDSNMQERKRKEDLAIYSLKQSGILPSFTAFSIIFELFLP